MKKISNLTGIIVVTAAAAVLFGVVFAWAGKQSLNFQIKGGQQNQANLSDENLKEINACNALQIPEDPTMCIIKLAVKYNNDKFCDELYHSRIDPSNVSVYKSYCLGMVTKDMNVCNGSHMIWDGEI